MGGRGLESRTSGSAASLAKQAGARAAVVDAQPATAAVLARLSDVGPQVAHNQPDAASRQAGDALANLGVGDMS